MEPYFRKTVSNPPPLLVDAYLNLTNPRDFQHLWIMANQDALDNSEWISPVVTQSTIGRAYLYPFTDGDCCGGY